MTLWSCIVEGEPASKANQRRPVWRRSKKTGKRYRAFIKSDKALAFSRSAILQMRSAKPAQPFRGDLAIHVTIWYASNRPDLDPSLIYDCLQNAEIIGNDRQIREQHIFHDIDKDRPRVLVMLSPRGKSNPIVPESKIFDGRRTS